MGHQTLMISRDSTDASYERRQLSVFVLLATILMFGLLAIYFHSPLRERIENKLFDLRVRLAPQFWQPRDVAICAITADTLRVLSSPRVSGLSYSALTRLAKQVLAAKPQMLVIVLQLETFGSTDEGFADLFRLSQNDARVVLATADDLSATTLSGVAGILQLDPASSRLRNYGGIERQNILPSMVRADLNFAAKNAVIRTLPIGIDDKSPEERPFLLPFLADRLIANRSQEVLASSTIDVKARGRTTKQFLINYLPLENLTVINASQLITNKPDATPFQGRIVFLGFAETTDFPSGSPSTNVNTPWQSEGEDATLAGVPAISVLAIGVDNILNRRWLHRLPSLLNVLQTAFMSLYALSIWRFGISAAVILLGIGWIGLLLLHAVGFSLFSSYLPICDTIAFSAFATIAGGLWWLQKQGKLRAVEQAKAESERELADTQSRFLDTLAIALDRKNEEVLTLLKKHQSDAALADKTPKEALRRSLLGAEELRDYLSGMRQLSTIKTLGRIKLQPVAVEPLIKKVMSQFDFHQQASKLQIQINAEKDATALADERLLEQILDNLMANAIKYSPPHGKIDIRVYAKSATRLIIAIKDQGPGIAPEFHERIFEKFYRVKDDLVYKVKGYGLGLFLSRYFAMRIKASIQVKSARGSGSEFFLELRK